jgi:hypothetical protein
LSLPATGPDLAAALDKLAARFATDLEHQDVCNG